MKTRFAVFAGAAALAGALFLGDQKPATQVLAAPMEEQVTSLPGGGQLKAVSIGHEYRQDDLPDLAVSPDGTLWATWLSFVGDRDDIGLRQYKNGNWGPLQWVPNTSGDSWLPQVAVDSNNVVWVVWSQQVRNNWDLYTRSYNPANESWGPVERLTSHALPDINPRLASDAKGRFAVVWQGFRGKNSNIFLKTFENGKWSAEIRVTNRAANDWEPAVEFDSKGSVWVAYDSYKAGNYDVYLAKVTGTQVAPEMAVASTEAFEAKPTLAVDTGDRVWVAWEQGGSGWGKDQGYVLRQDPKGVQLGGVRKPHVRIYDNGQWRDPALPLSSAFEEGNSYQPHVFCDGKGSVWVAAKRRLAGPAAAGRAPGYWEYWMTHYEGSKWSQPFALPASQGRSSTRMNAALDKENKLWLAWDTDNRKNIYFHKPRRQQIFAGALPTASPATISWGEAPGTNAAAVTSAHPTEVADVRAIRTYTATIEGKPHNIVRGDFHRHTELSWDGGGAQDGSLLDFYRYMIDAGAMDFGASTDHQGGAWPYWWWFTMKMTDMHHVPGAYTAIYGYERSATFPNGHRNMFFVKRSDARVTPFFLRNSAQQWYLGENRQGDEPGVGSGDLVANDTKLLYEEIRNRNAVAISHTSGTRMGTDWRDNDPTLEPVVEIYQGARTNYEVLGGPLVAEPEKDGPHVKQAGYQTEGMVFNAWAKGYKLGIITSSDHGSTHISYAMVYTADKSRQGILDAIRKRHTYGAMDNIILDVRMGPHFMGDEFPLTAAAPIQVKIQAPRAIAKVDILKDGKSIYSTSPNAKNAQFEFTDKGDVAGRHYYYVRVQQDNRMLAWSSPFFVNYPKSK